MASDSWRTCGAPGSQWLTPKRLAVLLVVGLLAAFPKVFVGLDSFFYRDYGVLAYPCAFYQQQSFWRGELPLWNPLSHCGVPFLAQWGTNLYPFALIYLIFPLPWALSYFCLAHLLLAGLGMYFLARRWTNSPFASGLAGTAYVFSGVTFSCLLWPNYTVALGWMPWVVLCVERSWREGARWLVAAAVASALQILSGVPEVILLTWVLLGLLWLDGLVRGDASRCFLVGRGAVVVGLTAGLVAVQMLPFFDLLAHSQRDPGFAKEKWTMPVWGLANLLVPRFRCAETSQGIWFQDGQGFLTSYYAGAGVLVLAAWGVWQARQRRVWLMAGLASLCLVLAMGEGALVFGWLKGLLPVVGIARYPVKFVLLSAFLIPLLAAWGVSKLERGGDPPKRPGWSLAVVGGVALLIMAIILCRARDYTASPNEWAAAWMHTAARALFLVLLVAGLYWLMRMPLGRGYRTAQAAMLILIVADTLTHMRGQVPSIPASLMAPGLWQEQQSSPAPAIGRSRLMITPEADHRLLRTGASDHRADFIGRRLAEWSNLHLLDGIPKVNGAATLQLRAQKGVESLLYGCTNQLPVGLLDFLSVSHVSSPSNAVEWLVRSNYCPWVTCGQKPIFAAGTNVLQALADHDFDPRRLVYMSPECRDAVTVSNQTECRIVGSRFSAKRVELEVEAREASLVVIAQSYYHPWRVTIDEKPGRLLKANHAFQAVEVPAGRHKVVLAYRDRMLGIGFGVSLATMLACLLLWIRRRIGRDRALGLEPLRTA